RHRECHVIGEPNRLEASFLGVAGELQDRLRVGQRAVDADVQSEARQARHVSLPNNRRSRDTPIDACEGARSRPPRAAVKGCGTPRTCRARDSRRRAIVAWDGCAPRAGTAAQACLRDTRCCGARPSPLARDTTHLYAALTKLRPSVLAGGSSCEEKAMTSLEK